MSSVYQPKRKELANVKVVSSSYYNANRSSLKYVGSVNRGFTTFVTTKRDIKTGQCSFIDDTSALTRKAKNDVAKFFSNHQNSQKHVVYLVVPKNKVSNSNRGQNAKSKK